MKKIIYLIAIGISIVSCNELEEGVNGCECGKNEMNKNADKDLAKKCDEHLDGLDKKEQRKFLNDKVDCMAEAAIEN